MTLRCQSIYQPMRNVSFTGDGHADKVVYSDLHCVAGLARSGYLGVFVDAALAWVKGQSRAY